MSEHTLNDLIGIRFKIGKENLDEADCVGLAWLYQYLIKGKNYPHRDGKRLYFRDKKKDIERIVSVIETWAHRVEFEDIQEGDILILNSIDGVGGIATMTGYHRQVLLMDAEKGSMLLSLNSMKDIFLIGYRANEA